MRDFAHHLSIGMVGKGAQRCVLADRLIARLCPPYERRLITDYWLGWMSLSRTTLPQRVISLRSSACAAAGERWSFG
jgi:hypothetical protein